MFKFNTFQNLENIDFLPMILDFFCLMLFCLLLTRLFTKLFVWWTDLFNKALTEIRENNKKTR